MSEIHTRWPVAQHHKVAPGDLDDTGAVRAETVRRWVEAARAAHLAACAVLQSRVDERHAIHYAEPHRTVSISGRPESVIVTAGVPEFRPNEFTLVVRLRPVCGDEERPVNVVCDVQLVDAVSGTAEELGNDVRDELIALEHGARHFN